MLLSKLIHMFRTHAQCDDCSEDQNRKGNSQIVDQQVKESRRRRSLARDCSDDCYIHSTHTWCSHKGEECA